jgi:predicted secreted protein
MQPLTRTRATLLAALLLLNAGQLPAAEAPQYNHIHLQAQSSMKVDNDRMQAVMSVFGEGSDTAKLADQINSTMSWALKTAKQYPQVNVGSGQYQTFPVYGKEAVKRWRSTQEVTLEAGDAKPFVQLLGILQERLQVNSIIFSVSPPQRTKAEDVLIDQALSAFQTRAERVRKDLGAKSYRIVDLNISSNTGVIPPYPMARAQAMESAVTAPAIESGSSTLTVNAEGTIELQF